MALYSSSSAIQIFICGRKMDVDLCPAELDKYKTSIGSLLSNCQLPFRESCWATPDSFNKRVSSTGGAFSKPWSLVNYKWHTVRWEKIEKLEKCYVIFMIFLCLHACYKSIFPLNTNQWTASVKKTSEVFFVQRAKGRIFAGAFYTHLKPFTMLLMTSWSKQKKTRKSRAQSSIKTSSGLWSISITCPSVSACITMATNDLHMLNWNLEVHDYVLLLYSKCDDFC